MKSNWLRIIFLVFLPQTLLSQQAWERITPLPQEHSINSMVKIPGSDRLMAVCNGSTVITSDDGGEHWDLHLNPGGMSVMTGQQAPSTTYRQIQHCGFLKQATLHYLQQMHGKHIIGMNLRTIHSHGISALNS